MPFEKLTPEEITQQNKKNKRKTGIAIRMVRIARDNPDIAILMLVIVSVFFAGYFFCRIYLGLTANEIRTELSEFVGLIFFMITTVFAGLGKLYVKQGVISSSLSGRISNDHDVSGNSIIPR
jgi:hypothetical protein